MTDELARLTAALADRYEIGRELGVGGMATVYLARDLKHDRHVALKVLKPELVAVLGAERFLQEIKTTANLQHPHILPLFDSGEADGVLYYVMPFIDGETLREKLDRETQLGVEEAVSIASDVADALDYAHRHDVIHRDIKPENILIHDGRPVVADFGIALAVSAAAGGRMTETGLSLGTPHYMSPEQATAERDLTNRSDIYSLGSVLYEMLTGDPPHTGPAAQVIVMRILTEEPRPVSAVRRAVPPNVSATVAKSLQKLAADRFASAAAFRAALADATFTDGGPSSAGSLPQGAGAPGRGSWLADLRSKLAVTAVAVLALILGWVLAAPKEAIDPAGGVPTTRFTIDLGDIREPGGLALSPDGSLLVVSGQRPGGPRLLFKRHADRVAFEAIPDTRQGEAPVFSPDGEWIAFVSQLDIVKVPSRGGPASTILQHETPISSVHWSDDNTIMFTDNRGLLWSVPASGGSPERLLRSGTLRGCSGPAYSPTVAASYSPRSSLTGSASTFKC
jgi:serine/threonine-protein kinase